MAPAKELSLKDLTLKLVMSVLIVTGQRLNIISMIECEDSNKMKDPYQTQAHVS